MCLRDLYGDAMHHVPWKILSYTNCISLSSSIFNSNVLHFWQVDIQSALLKESKTLVTRRCNIVRHKGMILYCNILVPLLIVLNKESAYYCNYCYYCHYIYHHWIASTTLRFYAKSKTVGAGKCSPLWKSKNDGRDGLGFYVLKYRAYSLNTKRLLLIFY